MLGQKGTEQGFGFRHRRGFAFDFVIDRVSVSVLIDGDKTVVDFDINPLRGKRSEDFELFGGYPKFFKRSHRDALGETPIFDRIEFILTKRGVHLNPPFVLVELEGEFEAVLFLPNAQRRPFAFEEARRGIEVEIGLNIGLLQGKTRKETVIGVLIEPGFRFNFKGNRHRYSLPKVLY